MLNEEVSNQVKEEVVKHGIQIMFKVGKLTMKALIDGLNKAALKIREEKENPHGQMKIKDLIRKDQGAQAIDIDGAGLGDFKRIARKYGVDFAIVKSKEQDTPQYSVFFKAKDADAINAVVNEYTAKQMRIGKEGRPSLLEKLGKFKAIVAALPKKVVEKHKEADR